MKGIPGGQKGKVRQGTCVRHVDKAEGGRIKGGSGGGWGGR